MLSSYDPYVRTATGNYQGLVIASVVPCGSSSVPGPMAIVRRAMPGRSILADGTAGRQPRPRLCTLRLRWFDRWLRGVDKGVETEPAVWGFVMGGGSGRRNAAGRL